MRKRSTQKSIPKRAQPTGCKAAREGIAEGRFGGTLVKSQGRVRPLSRMEHKVRWYHDAMRFVLSDESLFLGERSGT